jgi:hypothetical protein
MKKLIEYTRVLRSKNAGPLFITFDLIFGSFEQMKYVLERLSAEDIARAYNVERDSISIIAYEVVNSIKITFPRKSISGSVDDTDVYGCQMHAPLAAIEIGD